MLCESDKALRVWKNMLKIWSWRAIWCILQWIWGEFEDLCWIIDVVLPYQAFGDILERKSAEL